MSKDLAAYRDMQSDWHRWQMQDLDEPVISEAQPEQEAAPTPEELHAQAQNVLEQAQTRGHQQGYDAGHQQGYQAGHQIGMEQGQQEGHEAGYKAGMAQAQDELAQHKQVFTQLSQACSQSIAALNEQMGQSLITLATQIAEHVLQHALTTQPDSILGIVQEILQADPDEQSLLTLHLHPDDLAIVRPYLQEHSETRPWRLQADPALQRGDCLARSAFGDIDATLATRWRRSLATLGRPSTQEAIAPLE